MLDNKAIKSTLRGRSVHLCGRSYINELAAEKRHLKPGIFRRKDIVYPTIKHHWNKADIPDEEITNKAVSMSWWILPMVPGVAARSTLNQVFAKMLLNAEKLPEGSWKETNTKYSKDRGPSIWLETSTKFGELTIFLRDSSGEIHPGRSTTVYAADRNLFSRDAPLGVRIICSKHHIKARILERVVIEPANGKFNPIKELGTTDYLYVLYEVKYRKKQIKSNEP